MAKRDPFAEKYFSNFRDSHAEILADQEDMDGIIFTGQSVESESLEEYSEDIFVYYELWTTYLKEESLLYFGWSDVKEDCFWEAQYNPVPYYLLICLIFVILQLFQFNFLSYVYLTFAMSYYCYDEELEHNTDDPRQQMKEMRRYVKDKEANFKYQRQLANLIKNGRNMGRYDPRWRAFYCFFLWDYDYVLMDELNVYQWMFVLGRSCSEGDELIDYFREYYISIVMPFMNRYYKEMLIAICLYEKKKNPKLNIGVYYWQNYILWRDYFSRLDYMDLEIFDIRLIKHKILFSELITLKAYAKNWYSFKNLSPKKFKKYNYIL